MKKNICHRATDYVDAGSGCDTDPDAGAVGIDNLQYDQHADAVSWQCTKDFLVELFSK